MFGATTAAAQTAPNIPSPTREEIERPLPAQVEPRAPRLAVEGGIERSPCALDRPEYQHIRFTPNEVIFEDLRGLSSEAMRAAYADYLGTEQPVSVVCEIRDRAATMLRNAGYLASVEVPEQRIADGQIRFKVLVGRMVAIRVRGDAGRAERLIAAYLQPLTEQALFNRFEAERYLLLAGDIPGYSVRLNVQPAGQVPGEVVGEVTVLRTAVLIDANVQNYGSNALGPWGVLLRGQVFGLTGLGDRTTIAAFTTLDFSEQQTLQVAHDFRLGGEGLTFGGQLTLAWAAPDLDDPAFAFESRTLFATIEGSYPFVRSQAATVRGSAGLDFVNQDTDVNGIDLNRDRLRVAFLRMTGDAIDVDNANPGYSLFEPRWRLSSAVELRQGIDIFGASENCLRVPAVCAAPGALPPARFDGDPTATVMRGSVYGEFRPAPRFTAALSGRAQFSDDPLFSFEEFSAGNYTVGRGYDPGALLGDRGIGLQAELRYGSLYQPLRPGLALEPFLFIDQAWVWNEERLVLGLLDEGEVTSVGGGVRAIFADRFQLEAMLVVPLDRVGLPGRQPDPRFLISLTTRLWPWRL